MDETEIRRQLPFIRQVYQFEELDSTNDYAKSLVKKAQMEAAENIHFPALILAIKQTKGRGRRGKSWYSSEDSLTFSIIWETSTLPAGKIPFALKSGLWLAEEFNRLGSKDYCQVKWPNDVMAAEKKISGLLVEQVMQKESFTILGCGINVNNSFSGELGHIDRTSLSEQLGHQFDKTEVLIRVCQSWMAGLQFENNASLQEFHTRFEQLDFLVGRWLVVQVGDSKVQGRYAGLGPNGEIQLKDDGKMRIISNGSILNFGPAMT
jgi:BirA family transcriptional regulator, biotin operon repressor / biotin---[acetyl-CoA-carboxylase] ligase